MKLRELIKSIEFVLMVGLPALGWFLNGIDLIWFVLIAGGYVAVNLTGWATRRPDEAYNEVVKKKKSK